MFCLGSDGSQQEGDDAEAARLAVAQGLNVKLLIDDNDVTIAGHPSEYMKGYELQKTLEGHGLKVVTVQGEDLDSLWGGVHEILNYDGPAAVVSKRLMAPGVDDIEGTSHGHDVIPVKAALNYLKKRGHPDYSNILLEIKPNANPYLFVGSTKESAAKYGFITSIILIKY